MTTHATSLVLYQRKSSIPTNKSQMRPSNARKRTLGQDSSCQHALDFSATGKRPVPSCSGVLSDWNSQTKPSTLDLLWILFRIIEDVSESDHKQVIPGWSGFNAIVTRLQSLLTNVGYCPLFSASPTNNSTVYSVLKCLQHICDKIGQTIALLHLTSQFTVRPRRFSGDVRMSSVILSFV